MDDITNGISNATELISSKLVEWTEQFILMVPNLVISILVMAVFIFLGKIARNLVSRTLNRLIDSKALIALVATLAHSLVVIAGFLIALNLLDLEKTVTSILAGAGVIGLALGFAFQDTATNFISGVFLATRRPFRIGDIVQVAGIEPAVVEQINLRNTYLKTFQGQKMIVPNKDVFQNAITNYSTGVRRVDLGCGVSYGDDLEKVKRIAFEAIENAGIHKKDRPIELFYNEFGDSSINFTLRFWIDFDSQVSFLDARSKAIIALKKAFDENDITIPFPIRTLDFGIKGGVYLSEELGKVKSLQA
ncbi:MAG: mechanosensitive ion channel family protein [Salibacteraceae bacterium]